MLTAAVAAAVRPATHHVSGIEFFFEIFTAAGFTLTILGLMALAKVKRLGPATSGRFRYREAWAPFYVRIGPPLFVIGVIGLLLTH